jgi:GrpB-like predicted nucleotidyltransferase (UPF0157 family)
MDMTRAMKEEEYLRLAIGEGVTMYPYDPAWPVRFEEEKARLRDLFPFIRDIQHIGSTAIPGLQAKPIIDLLAGVDSMDAMEALVPPLTGIGYLYLPEQNLILPERRWLMRQKDGHRTHHLHLVVHNGPEWQRLITFRDALLHDTELRHRYALLKTDLADRVGHDRDTYTRSKSDCIQAVLQDA